MKKIFLIISTVAVVAACKSSKTTSTTASAEPSIVPGETQLKAIQSKYPETTMETLKEGHGIYTGVCTNCHGAKNIYSRSEEKWPGIIDNMAKKAKITDVQKDAVLKYVLAMKAAQPANSK